MNDDPKVPELKKAKLPRWSIAVWGVLGAILLLLWGQARTGVLHPWYVPLIVLLLSAAVAVVGAVVAAARDMFDGGRRVRTTLWIVATGVPIFLFALPFHYAQSQYAEREVPHGFRGEVAIVAGGSLMEAQAAWLYPNRHETERLVMFYGDLAAPRRDAAAMDDYVAELEQFTERPLKTKIHWVRGSLLGKSSLSFLGLALGSRESPDDWSGRGGLDRHELAHAVLTQYRPADADPPMVLHEGWAVSQSSDDEIQLARRVLNARSINPPLQLSDLFTAEWYHADHGPVYPYGGAFVAFLLREYGFDPFLELYNRCRVGEVDGVFESIYGKSLAELEEAFWRDVERAGRPGVDADRGE